MSSSTTQITSDLSLDATKFDPKQVAEETNQIKSVLRDVSVKMPKWTPEGSNEYRRQQEAGETPLPPPVLLPAAYDIEVPSRDPGRTVPARVYKPDNGQPSRGIILHFHGGAFVLGSHQHNDALLQSLANRLQLTAVSGGYRHAPEHPAPAAGDDCADVAEYLVDHGEQLFGAGTRLLFLTGQSSGGNLATLTALGLMRSRPAYELVGLVLYYGLFDASLSLPASSTYNRPLMINTLQATKFLDTYFPGLSPAERRHPRFSPLYEDLAGLATSAPSGKLPPALFHCGTDDLLVDDNILMSAHWQMTGSEGILKIYPGAPHGFDVLGGKVTEDAAAATAAFVEGKMAALGL